MRKLLLSLTAFLFFTGTLFAQRTLTGTVTDDKGNPLPNVSVVVKNTSVGTVTKSDGTYSLSVPAGATTLVFSIVDQAPVEREIGAQTSISVAIETADKALEEVVVVAYGTAKKRTFTGSATTLRNEDINKLQISTFTRALEGTVPGVNVTSGSGQPGSNSAIRIRGIGSINASAAPLIVVDGIQYGGDLNSINPSDIESISVLKDAASTALYGARAGNGVIVITTKKGKGKPKIEVQTRFGINQRAVPEYDVIRDPGQFLEVLWKSLRNEALNRAVPLSPSAAAAYASTAMYDAGHLNNYKNFSVPAGQFTIDPATGRLNSAASLLYNDDWDDIMYDNNSRQEHLISLSGSSEKTQYYLSFGYLNDKGYIVKSDFDRITTRLRLDQQVTNWLKGGLNLTYGKSKQKNTQGGNTTYQNSFFFTRVVAPAYPVWVRNAQGNFVYDSKGQRIYDFGAGTAAGSMGTRTFAGTENPRGTLDLDIRNRDAYNTSSRAYLELTPVKNLTITINHGIDISNAEAIGYQNPQYGNAAGASVQGRSTITDNKDLTENFNQLLNYTQSFGNHNFDLLLGHESYKLTSKFLSAQNQFFIFPGDPDLSGGTTINGANSETDRYNIEGYFSQLRYDFDGKYLLSGSYRRDGSSRFAPGDRWGNFWSVGAGWNISSEKFMQNIKFLNLLKLKFSYGEKGNDDLQYVAGDGRAGPNYYPWQTQYMVNQTSTPNLLKVSTGSDSITWESNADLNYGLEFALLKGRLTGSFEYFKRRTKDMLFPRPPAFSTGAQSFPDNIGEMENKGFEAELSYEIVRNNNFRWSVSANATHFKNTIFSIPPENEKLGGLVTGNNKLLRGHSIFEFFTWAYAGVDQATGSSLWYKDLLGSDGKPTGVRDVTSDFSGATRYYTGKTSTPDVTGGVSTQLSYKGFDLSIITSFGIGGWVYDGPYQGLMYAGGGDITTWHKDILKAWDPLSPSETSVPRLQEGYQNANATSDRWLTKGDYFNLRNVSMGYTLAKNVLEKYGVSSLRVYVVGDNIWLNTRRQGMDPRQDFGGNIGNAYSPIRTVSIGLNVIF